MDRASISMGTLVGAGVAFGLLLTGCAHKSSLLLERQARGPLEEESAIAERVQWQLSPDTQVKILEAVEITVRHTTTSYLNEFFRNKQIFGAYAGLNPYFPEQVVFYVKIANHSGRKIRVKPDDFILIDDRANQYQCLTPDYNTALAEAKAPVGTFTRGVLDEAHPGYFGVGVPVGKILAKPQQLFALMKMSSLQEGYLFDGVVYDGLIAFWSPHREAHQLKLILSNVKIDFEANDLPKKALDFTFDFSAALQQQAVLKKK